MDTLSNPEPYSESACMKIHPVILSGGSGTRLWPLSRADRPKQFLKLLSDRSLLQETAARAAADNGFASPIIVCNEEHRFLVLEQLAEVSVTPRTLLLEPVARNTAPAIAVAALWLVAHDPEAVMLVQPADHAIGSVDRLHRAVARGLAAAQAGRLVTFGIRPDHAAVGYGYIQAGDPVEDADGALIVERFVEKPDRDMAQRFVDSGAFYWNSGIFLMRARTYLDELARIDLAMAESCRRSFAAAKSEGGCVHLHGAAFREAASLSIDHAVMEHTDRAAVVPVEMAWSDVGSWRSLHRMAASDKHGNSVHGDVRHKGVRNCHLRSEGRLLVAAGLDDLVVVATDDAVLVAGAESTGEVAGLLQELRKEKRSEPLRDATCHRPWGSFRTIDSGERFKVKRITVKPGAKLGVQRHFNRSEHWVVVRGTGIVECGAERQLVHESQAIFIPVGREHRIENPGKVVLEFIEVQSGSYLADDDVARIAESF